MDQNKLVLDRLRLQLMEELWDSVGAAPESDRLRETQERDLDRRLDTLGNPTVGSTWEKVKLRLQQLP